MQLSQCTGMLRISAAVALRGCLSLLALGAALPAVALPVAVASGVYAELGDNDEITPDNGGQVANSGFIVGRDRVLAVDTGVSFRAGEALLKAIAGVTRKPVMAAVLTHAAQEFIFGAAAFQARGIPVIAQRRTAELMQQRCTTCLNRLQKLLGDAAMAGSTVVTPEQQPEGSTSLDLGGRRVDLRYSGWASTPGDLALFDPQTGTLFAGGLVSAGRIPTLRDGRIDGWIAALETLRKLPLRVVVPGFGAPGSAAEIDQMLAYLRQLKTAVGQHYRDGASLIETMRGVDLPAFRNWRGYSSTQPQNVLYVYRQLEDADFR